MRRAALEAKYVLQQVTIKQAEADLNAKIARAAFANQDAVRYRDLAATTFGTRQNAERASAADEEARSGIRSAQAGLAAARNSHGEIFAKLGSSQVQHSPEAQGAGHIIGTARMGSDPKTSVVDRDLRSHDHGNLFILGSSVFPTSTTANPTLTIAALSLRAASAVKAALGA